MNGSRISTYEKIHFELKKVHTEWIWSIIGKYIKKSERVVSMRSYIPKIAGCYPFLINCSGFFLERENFIHFSVNIKCCNFKNRVIYHNEEERVRI